MHKIKIFQICHTQEQIDTISPGLEVWDNVHTDRPELCEFPCFRRIFEHPATKHDVCDFFGTVSPKFTEKTGMPPTAFAEWIEKVAPPYTYQTDWDGNEVRSTTDNLLPEVFFINPVPIVESLFPSTLYHGNNCHAGLAGMMQRIFNKMDLKVDLNTLFMDTQTFSLCNYFAGNRVFWYQYLQFGERFLAEVEKDTEASEMMYRRSAQYGRNANLAYYPFVMERMLSVFLNVHPQLHGRPEDCIPIPDRDGKIVPNVYARLIIHSYEYDREQFLEKTKLPKPLADSLRGLSDIKKAAVSLKQPHLMNTWSIFRNQIAAANPNLFLME